LHHTHCSLHNSYSGIFEVWLPCSTFSVDYYEQLMY
jgi:hypothetical protein